MRIFTILLLIGLFASCRSKEVATKSSAAKTFNQLKWLSGTWFNESDKGVLYEIWERNGSSEYAGRSFFISGKDTLFSESIRIVKKDEYLLYIPVVRDQNDGNPVQFRLIDSPKKTWIFENKQHDFPQRIIYMNPAPDSLVARIEGVQEGRFSAEDFIMIRKK
ncbi:MAG: DUF6265 family protein [Saprospiraceae bacterium]